MWLGNAWGKKHRIRNFTKIETLDKKILPKHISPEEKEKLVQRLRSGDDSAINPLILCHIRLAIAIATEYVQFYPNKRQDIISEVMLSLINTIRNARERLYDNNITPYIAKSIHGAIYSFINHDDIIVVPPQTIADYAARGEVLEKPKIISLRDDMELDAYDEDSSEIYRADNSDISIYAPDYEKERDVMETIDAIIMEDSDPIRQEMKRKIIHLRAVGYTDEEIAATLNVSDAYVWKLKNEIRKKYYTREAK